MKKCELLVPVGNKEMLFAAIHNGADAVYLGGKSFGARAYAENFNNNEIIEAIETCHLYGVKIYVTANTLIKEDEVDDFVAYIKFLHTNGVDAVIMQDLGMINLIHHTFPNLEIHASTQCHTTNDESLEFLKSLGVKRAVLAREMSLKEIANLKCNVEKEIFIHGALCISYSGQCLFSSMILNRSGNRGECAGMCRLPYEAYYEGKRINLNGNYLLSPKDLCTITNLNEILKLNIDSLKIEGRMKSPLYVAYVTYLYRKYIDAFYNNLDIFPTKKEIKILKVLYNREFTLGYLFNDKNIMNPKTPNHIGYKIGKVKSFSRKIKILLIDDIKQGDAIRFINNNLGMYLNYIYDEKGKLINSAKKGQTIYIDNKINLSSIDEVYKTYDKSLENILTNRKKIPIQIIFNACLNKPLTISIKDESNNIVTVQGKIVEKAKKIPTSKNIIKEKLSKISDTPFKISQFHININENCFIPMSDLNILRREVIEKLINARKEIKNLVEINKYKKYIPLETSIFKNIEIIHNEKDYSTKKGICYYTENKVLYNKYKQNKNIYFILPRISNNLYNYKNEYLVINNIGDLYKYYKNNTIHTGLYMNVYNTYTIDILKKYNVQIITLFPEIKNLFPFNLLSNISYLKKGNIELMIIKENIFNNYNKLILKDRNKEEYTYCQKNNYFIIEKYFESQVTTRNNLIEMKEELVIKNDKICNN